MAILIDETKRVLVQGITGREGQARTRLMREYGTNVVAGVTPGKGGQTVLGVPVFNTPQDAVNALGKIDISVLFVSWILATNSLGSEASSLLLLTRTIPFSTSSFTALSASREEKLECASICSMVSPDGFSKREK